MTLRLSICAALGLGLLAACGDDDIILPGERFDIRPQATFESSALPITLAAPVANADWTHRSGTPSQSIAHPALGAALQPQFAVEIGEGNSRGARITSHPVVLDGVVYTIDAGSTVSAVGADGAMLWQRDMRPMRADAGAASGGGLAAGGGRIYVTTGFGEALALDAQSGDIIWVQDLDAPANAAPTLGNGLVYVVARNSTAWAIDIDTGRIRWQRSGSPSDANFGSGASPAVSGQFVVLPFPSGEVLATYPRGGINRWSTVVSGDRVGRVASVVTDISGDPVIVGNRVYIGNFGGRTTALDLSTGDRLWTAAEGATSPVWVAGGSVFLINDINELVRLDANSGAPIWRETLPSFDQERETRRQRSVVAHYGPILAGGRLVVASSDGVLREFDPVSGSLTATTDLPSGAASGPVVAGNTLYVQTTDGQLRAFR